MLIADKNNNRAIEQGQVVVPTGPMIKGSRPFYWILLKEANLLMSWSVYGDHTVEAYSSCGQTRVLNSVDFRSLLWTRIFRLRKPIV